MELCSIFFIVNVRKSLKKCIKRMNWKDYFYTFIQFNYFSFFMEVKFFSSFTWWSYLLFLSLKEEKKEKLDFCLCFRKGGLFFASFFFVHTSWFILWVFHIERLADWMISGRKPTLKELFDWIKVGKIESWKIITILNLFINFLINFIYLTF